MPKWKKAKSPFVPSKSPQLRPPDKEFNEVLLRVNSLNAFYQCGQKLGEGAYGTVYLSLPRKSEPSLQPEIYLNSAAPNDVAVVLPLPRQAPIHLNSAPPTEDAKTTELAENLKQADSSSSTIADSTEQTEIVPSGSVAIKKIVTRDLHFLADVDREIWYLAQCRGQANLCQLIQAYRKNQRRKKSPNVTYLVMELYEGNLFSYIRKSRDAKQSIDFKRCLDHLSKGLLFLHDRHIIHRDLSTGNIFLRRTTEGEFDFVIGDFGLSRQFANNQHFPEFIGNSVRSYEPPANYSPDAVLGIDLPIKPLTSGVTTREFRAPEIFLQSDFYTSSIDCWSLGVVLFNVAFHEQPFSFDPSTQSHLGMFDLFQTAIWPHFNTSVANPHEAEAPQSGIELEDLTSLGPPVERIERNRPTELQRHVLYNLLLLAPASRFTMRKLRDQFALDTC
jgi:serine/threonine protein kinase